MYASQKQSNRLAHVWIIFGTIATLTSLGAMGYLLLFTSEDQAAGELLSLSAVEFVGVIAGLGLLSGRTWFRWILGFEAVLHLIAFPIGTALAVYTFWALAKLPSVPVTD